MSGGTGEGFPAPPFGGTGSTAGFGLMVAGLLVLPLVLAAFGVPTRANVYDEVPTRSGPFAHYRRQIFEETSDLDLVFVGSSLLWAGIDTPLVKARLSESLGRECRVVSLGYNWQGDDLTYTLLSDLLARRKVGLVVTTFTTIEAPRDGPHSQSFRWLDVPHLGAIAGGLSWGQRVALYGESVLGAPRHVLTLARPNRRTVVPGGATLGALQVREGYLGAAFRRYDGAPPVLDADALILSPATRERFRFSDAGVGPYEAHFVRSIGRLLHERGVKAAVLSFPLERAKRDRWVSERADWSGMLGGDVAMIGVPPAELFRDLDDETVRLLYYNQHLNVNGSRFFTQAVLPAILKVLARAPAS
jgi:hypothetical protein